jgi:hypothetical protein
MEPLPRSQILFGRIILPGGAEHACRAVALGVAGAELLCPFAPDPGMKLMVNLEHFGLVEGVSAAKTEGGFRIDFVLEGAARERFLARQAWLRSKQPGESQDNRQFSRRQLHGARSRVTVSDGRQYPCEIVDVSLTGAGVTCEVVPAIGSKVYLGKMLGSVVRYVDNGFAIEFLTAFGSDFLAEIIVDEPQ